MTKVRNAISIRYALGDCSLGKLLVAATERGVCAILLGDDVVAVVSELRGRFANAQSITLDESVEPWLNAAIALIEQPTQAFDLPLDLHGTPFQLRVWQALRAIPAGTTVTYTQLAQSMNLPAAVRAVASANAANPIAVAIPCHRVLRRDGALGGYYWGLERKAALLERERALLALSR